MPFPKALVAPISCVEYWLLTDPSRSPALGCDGSNTIQLRIENNLPTSPPPFQLSPATATLEPSLLDLLYSPIRPLLLHQAPYTFLRYIVTTLFPTPRTNHCVSMAPGQTSNSKQDMMAKDAMFILELMRDSPQAILFHITPYCQKTGTKPNTIVKRLGEIKKRNHLNIITTTSSPGGPANSYTAPKAASAARRDIDADGEGKPKIKRERGHPEAGKQNPPEAPFAGPVKVETKHALGLDLAYGLPSPPESGAGSAAMPVTTGSVIMPQMPRYMPQKRGLDDCDSMSFEAVFKKIKTDC